MKQVFPIYDGIILISGLDFFEFVRLNVGYVRDPGGEFLRLPKGQWIPTTMRVQFLNHVHDPLHSNTHRSSKSTFRVENSPNGQRSLRMHRLVGIILTMP